MPTPADAPRRGSRDASRPFIQGRPVGHRTLGDINQVIDDIAEELRGLHISELAGRVGNQWDGQNMPCHAVAAEMLAGVVQPYLDEAARRARLGARRAAADIGVAVLLGLYECREETGDDMILTHAGLPDAVDNLARTVYKALRAAHVSLPGLTDECPEWTDWYQEWPYL